MKIDELRAKTAAELKQELIELTKANFGLRMQLSAGQLTKTSEIRKVKRDIARVKTILTEKGVSA